MFLQPVLGTQPRTPVFCRSKFFFCRPNPLVEFFFSRMPTEHQLFSLFKTSNGAICWLLLGRPRFTCIHIPTIPLAHWPFQRQTIEWLEVSPKVILWVGRRLKCPQPGFVASQGLATLLTHHDLSVRCYSPLLAGFDRGRTLLHCSLADDAQLSPLLAFLLRYLTPQILRQCNIAFLTCDISYSKD